VFVYSAINNRFSCFAVKKVSKAYPVSTFSIEENCSKHYWLLLLRPLCLFFLQKQATTLSLQDSMNKVNLVFDALISLFLMKLYTDVRNMIESLRMACDLQRDTPEHDSTVQSIRKQMSDFVSFYRRNPNVAGSPSFSTIYTAINTVAGHYTTFGTEYPIPEKRKARLEQQFKDIERAVSRGR